MTTRNSSDEIQARVKELQEENDLLLEHLHVVQEELERLYLEKSPPATAAAVAMQPLVFADERLPECLAENRYLRAIAETRKDIHRLETANALASRIGEILIEGTASAGAFAGVPAKLLKVWREANQQTPPDTLGGKDFGKVIAAYREGGLAAVDALIASASPSPTVQANALTALARDLMRAEPGRAAELARRAYAIGPRPFRLKWLAFRLHEAGELTEAEAMLDCLPEDTPFSDSETRLASRLRYEARQVRLRDAKRQCEYSESRTAIEQQLARLTRERDDQQRLAADFRREAEMHKAAASRLEQEKSGVVVRQQEQEKLATERGREVEALKAALTKLEQERSGVVVRQQEQEKLATERGRELEALKAAIIKLEQEKSGVVVRQQEHEKLATERGVELDALKAALTKLEQERSGVVVRQQEQEKLAIERGVELEALKAALTKLEQERSGVVVRQQEQEKLAAERLKQLDDLQQQIKARHAEEAELAARQRLMQEELVRAEAQIDLIKDMLLREPGL